MAEPSLETVVGQLQEIDSKLSEILKELQLLNEPAREAAQDARFAELKAALDQITPPPDD
jgi:hypothetical protein